MKFDLSTNTWKNIANMNVGRSSAGKQIVILNLCYLTHICRLKKLYF